MNVYASRIPQRRASSWFTILGHATCGRLMTRTAYLEDYGPPFCDRIGFAVSPKFIDCLVPRLGTFRFIPFEAMAVGILAGECGVEVFDPDERERQRMRRQKDKGAAHMPPRFVFQPEFMKGYPWWSDDTANSSVAWWKPIDSSMIIASDVSIEFIKAMQARYAVVRGDRHYNEPPYAEVLTVSTPEEQAVARSETLLKSRQREAELCRSCTAAQKAQHAAAVMGWAVISAEHACEGSYGGAERNGQCLAGRCGCTQGLAARPATIPAQSIVVCYHDTELWIPLHGHFASPLGRLQQGTDHAHEVFGCLRQAQLLHCRRLVRAK